MVSGEWLVARKEKQRSTQRRGGRGASQSLGEHLNTISDQPSLNDYVEIDAVLRAGHTLESGLRAAREKWDGRFNALLILKALCYFGDGNVSQLSEEAKQRLRKMAASVSLHEFASGRTLSLEEVARRMVWFEEPAEALRSSDFFLAHVMTYGTVQDVVTAEKYFTREDFLHALENAPPGVFDVRSWTYWNTIFGRVPVPEMPRRRLE